MNTDKMMSVPEETTQIGGSRIGHFTAIYLLSLALVVAVLIGEFIFPSKAQTLDKLLSPAMWLAARLPGGPGHNPLNIPLGLALEAAILGGVCGLIWFLWQRFARGAVRDDAG